MKKKNVIYDTEQNLLYAYVSHVRIYIVIPRTPLPLCTHVRSDLPTRFCKHFQWFSIVKKKKTIPTINLYNKRNDFFRMTFIFILAFKISGKLLLPPKNYIFVSAKHVCFLYCLRVRNLIHLVIDYFFFFLNSIC